jgi:NAD(P)H-nitrite reductase large subunit
MIGRGQRDADHGDPRICYCMRVHRSTLVAAILGGARTLAALQAATSAGTGCGTCRIDLLELLAAHAPSCPSEEHCR